MSVASSADGTKLVAAAHDGYIYTSADSGATWTQRGSSQAWVSVASSADGKNLVAAVCDWNSSSGYVYTSGDAGATWTEQTGSTSQCWQSVASSADGTKLVAGGNPGYLCTSSGPVP
jgi:photosystem II stability/assembly factor-like uncharacterized protein